MIYHKYRNSKKRMPLPPPPPEPPVKVGAYLCAPAGECEYCDRRREHAREAMRKLRDRRSGR